MILLLSDHALPWNHISIANNWLLVACSFYWWCKWQAFILLQLITLLQTVFHFNGNKPVWGDHFLLYSLWNGTASTQACNLLKHGHSQFWDLTFMESLQHTRWKFFLGWNFAHIGHFVLKASYLIKTLASLIAKVETKSYMSMGKSYSV